jgi:hypothetical protein
VIVEHWHEAVKPAGPATSGLNWKIFLGAWTELPDFSGLQPALAGQALNLTAGAPETGTPETGTQGPGPLGLGKRATIWDGWINIPADGGYTFHLIDPDGERLVIDGMEVAKTGPPFGLVCGAAGNALRYDRGSIGLRAGLHTVHVEALNTATEGAPRLLWEGPGLTLADVPEAVFSHSSQ